MHALIDKTNSKYCIIKFKNMHLLLLYFNYLMKIAEGL